MKKDNSVIWGALSGLFFIIIGVILVIAPHLLKYIEVDGFNIQEIIKDEQTLPFGILFIVLGVVWEIGLLIVSICKKYCIISIFWQNKIESYKCSIFKHMKIHEYETPPPAETVLQELNTALYNMHKAVDKNEINTNKDYIFYGIAQIPFIFELGMSYGNDAKKYSFGHYFKRDKNNKLKLLLCGKRRKPLLVHFIDKQSKDLIVSVATSFPMDEITDECFQNKSLLCIESPEKGVDIINNISTLNQWAEQICDAIRNCVIENGINKVHLFLNTSSSMVFKLGTMLSNNYDPHILVYHYSKNSTVNRPWYLDTKGKKIYRTASTIANKSGK